MSRIGAGAPSNDHWASLHESGSFYGIQLLYWIDRLFGRWLFRILLYPVMAYFLLVRVSARRASLEYLTQIDHWRPGCLPARPGLWLVFRHLLSFGEAILDKVVAWSGGVREDDLEIVDAETYQAVKDRSCGRLLIGSHFGNLEYCRAFAHQNRSVTVNVLMHDRHAVNFNRMLKRADAGSRLNLYPVDSLDVATILELKEKVAAGEWLVIAADRIPVGESGRTVDVEFMGRAAPLPIGPYVLAATLECPVTLVFAWRQGARVAVRFERFAERIELTRRGRQDQLIGLAQRFADRLSAHCLLAPLQWFNFYPFWSQQERVDDHQD